VRRSKVARPCPSWVIHDVSGRGGAPPAFPHLPKTDQNLKALPFDAKGQ
jgi:hypothetical protein